MTNWIKVENDGPAVLRALADGKKVRYCRWLDHTFIRLTPPGCIVNEKGHAHESDPYYSSDFSGTWFIETPRDIATDPQAGDEFMWFRDRAKVAAVCDGFVFYHDGDVAGGSELSDWAMAFKGGDFKRIEAGK